MSERAHVTRDRLCVGTTQILTFFAPGTQLPAGPVYEDYSVTPRPVLGAENRIRPEPFLSGTPSLYAFISRAPAWSLCLRPSVVELPSFFARVCHQALLASA